MLLALAFTRIFSSALLVGSGDCLLGELNPSDFDPVTHSPPAKEKWIVDQSVRSGR
jgi:hypothetical protein